MSNLHIPPGLWLRDLFWSEYCDECGGDVQHHEAIPVMGNWFARCRFPSDERTGDMHPEVLDYRSTKEAELDHALSQVLNREDPT